MSDFKKKFGANLKALRKARKITQEKLSELIDVHYRQMSKIETGDNFPSSKTLEKLCFALKVSPAQLFDFDFIYDGEFVLTGTDDTPFFRAIKQGNVVVLEDYRGQKVEQEEISYNESGKRFLKIAKNLGKPVKVEYFENGVKNKILTYNPDGSIESFSEQNLALQQETEKLVELIKNLKNNHEYLDFVNLAIQSLENDTALEKLEFTINGIKLARKSR